MNVGIVTRYQPRDSTYAAIQLAGLARCMGNQASVYTTTPRRPVVHPAWDGRVVRDARFTDWAGPLDLVVWMDCPPADQLAWAVASGPGHRRRVAVLVASWEDSLSEIRTIYPGFAAVVAPSSALAAHLRECGTENLREIPWSPRLPVTCPRPVPDDRPISVHFPLCELQGREHDAAAVDLIERLLRVDMPVSIRASLDGRSGEVVRRLERRAKAHARLTLAKCNGFEETFIALGEHDLTALTTVSESFGMMALCSLHAGSPVIGPGAPPLDEFLVDGKNGALVAGEFREVQPGLVIPSLADQDAFEARLLAVLSDRAGLSGLRLSCTAGLEARAANFDELWAEFLSEERRDEWT